MMSKRDFVFFDEIANVRFSTSRCRFHDMQQNVKNTHISETSKMTVLDPPGGSEGLLWDRP